VRSSADQDDARDRESRSSQVQVQRAIVAEAMSRLRTSGTVEMIATSIARLVLKLPGLDFAGVLLFEADGAATPIGLALSTGPIPERRSLSLERSRSIRRKLRGGPWTREWTPSPDDPLSEAIANVDVTVMTYAPIRSGRDLLGFFVVGAGGPAAQATASELLPGLVEFAGLAGALLAPSVKVRRRHRRIRAAIRQIVQRSEFNPVFQPIVDLKTCVIGGYEALTRFHDGTAPDVKFAEAASVGLGPDLELATLEAIFRDARELPPGHSLNINATPALILAGDRLLRLIAGAERTVVCEITEHVAIEDYPAVRSALERLAGIQVAVDDAGAGFSSFRHILELRPSFVKLDRSLVAGIDGDPVRQALIAGMRHFALAAGCFLVAEGIETEAELATLRELEVPLGQGYLLGRAEPVGG
jgi:EAL domain-containing protein (putative c-di-GMP-specific phosphodiesterase class I)